MAITPCLFDEIYPSMVPNHSSPISTHIQLEDNWPKNAQDIAQKPIFNTNQGQQHCAYLTKFTHLQSQTTPPQYQLLYKV